jgi:hypothetical protein
MAKRARDAGTGQIVSLEEAEARPKETVVEEVTSLEQRVANIEGAIAEYGGLLHTLLKKR